MNICRQCGRPVPQEATFCAVCGAPVAVPGTAVAPPVPSPVPAPIAAPAQQSIPPQQPVPSPPSQQPTQALPPLPQTPPAPTQSFAPIPAAPVPPSPAAGAPPQPAFPGTPAPGAPVTVKRRLGGGAIAAIAGGIIAVIVAIALAIIIPNLAAVKAMLGFRPNNPIVVTADALASIGKLQSTGFTLSGDVNGTGFTLDGEYSLGSTTDKSMMYITVKGDGSTPMSFAWQNGAFGMSAEIDSYWTGTETQYAYASRADIRNAIRDTAGSEWDDVVIDTKNAIVRDGHWDFAGAARTFNEGAGGIDDNADVKRWNDGQMNEAAQAEYAKFALRFFGERLEKKDVQAKVFPKNERETSGGVTRLTYELDLTAFLRELATYWKTHEGDYPELRAYLIKQIREQYDGTRADAEDRYADALQRMIDGDYDTDMPRVDVSLEYESGRSLNTLDITVDGDGTTASLGLELHEKNKVSVDEPNVSDFMDQAKTMGMSL
ncbi:zinc ribbon domain-containing protein [Bifidobacterium aesculapii]|uniref:zinc ribbon domain-containing protein n=1 Tax=Bifidobacterium aesculapii TaxID=1329411 RepID=UPI000B133830|nr:zinc ribbon domain-containing protein [Bifidobacterium aesculapii]